MPRAATQPKANVVSMHDPKRFYGTPGALVEALPADLDFTNPGRVSMYDTLLLSLERKVDEAKRDPARKGQPMPGLCFEDIKARAGVTARAKKIGIKILMAEAGGKLYIRYVGRAVDDQREPRRIKILDILQKAPGPMTYMQITNMLRADGDETVDAGLVDLILVSMMKAGDVIRQNTGAWRLSLTKPVAK